ncbi:MAG: hypothetical protein ABL921_27135 [Pirellula sp.]
MFGIGFAEIIIFAVVLGVLVAPVVIIAAVVIFAIGTKNRPSGDSPNLYSCPDCRGNVSISAPHCPHCGRPSTTVEKIRASEDDDVHGNRLRV